MARLLNSFSKWMFSGRKRGRDEMEDERNDVDKDNQLFSIKMKRKTQEELKIKEGSYCPHCASEKFAKIYSHVNDCNGRSKEEVVRRINFNHDKGLTREIREESEEEEKEDLKGAEPHVENQFNQGDQIDVALDDMKNEEHQYNLISDVNRTTHLDSYKHKVIELKATTEIKTNLPLVVKDVTELSNTLPKASVAKPIQRKQFLTSSKLFTPLPNDKIDLIYTQLITHIKSRPYRLVLNSFTKDQFTTCLTALNRTSITSLPIDPYSFSTLSHCVNSEVIDYYSFLIMKRSQSYSMKMHIFPCEFYAAIAHNPKTSFDKVDLDSNALLFIPINLNEEHWCFVVIDLVTDELRYFDSLPNVFEIYTDQHIRNITDALATHNRQLTIKRMATPEQSHMKDSGVFLCELMNYEAIQRKFAFDRKDVEFFRFLIGIEIIEGELFEFKASN